MSPQCESSLHLVDPDTFVRNIMVLPLHGDDGYPPAPTEPTYQDSRPSLDFESLFVLDVDQRAYSSNRPVSWNRCPCLHLPLEHQSGRLREG